MAKLSFGTQDPNMDLKVEREISDTDASRILAYLAPAENERYRDQQHDDPDDHAAAEDQIRELPQLQLAREEKTGEKAVNDGYGRRFGRRERTGR